MASNELDCYLDAIVRTSMSVANTCEGSRKERIVQACQEVRIKGSAICSDLESKYAVFPLMRFIPQPLLDPRRLLISSESSVDV